MIDSWPHISYRQVVCVQLSLSGCDKEALWRACCAMVSAGERARAERFRRQEDALRHVAGRAVARGLLAANGARGVSSNANVREPEEFVVGPYGKPEVAGQVVHFNVTHSADEVWVAACREVPVGIDVECCGAADPERLGAMLHPREAAELMRLPVDARRMAFYRCWSRKESVSKAIGLGLSLPLDGFRVELDARPTAWLGDPPLGFDGWTVQDLAVPPGYFGAVAAPASDMDVTVVKCSVEHLLALVDSSCR